MRPLDSGMPLSRSWLWTPPICLDGAQSTQSPCIPPRNLANFVLQPQIRPAPSDNRARNSNNKNPARGALRAVLVAIEWPCRQPHAPFPFAREWDRSCDTSNPGPMPVRQTLVQSPDRVVLPVHKIAQPFQKWGEVCPDGCSNRALGETQSRLRCFPWACARSASFPSVTASLAIRVRSFVTDQFEWRRHRSNHDRNLRPKGAHPCQS